MNEWIWLFVIINFLITAWDSFASGALWANAGSRWIKIVAVCAGIIGCVGMFYTFIMVGVALSVLTEDFLLAANVFLGAPLICVGIVITINSWQVAIRERKWWQILITIWNSCATFWNIWVWIRSVQVIGKSMGGITSFLKGGGDSKAKAVIFLIAAVIATALISYGLFHAGKEFASRRDVLA